MAEATPRSQAELEQHLRDVADRLRGAEHLEDHTRSELAGLLDELSQSIKTANLPPEAIEHLVASTTHVADSLQHERPQGMLWAAREQLERTVLITQSRAPLLSGITRRLIDVLSNIGI